MANFNVSLMIWASFTVLVAVGDIQSEADLDILINQIYRRNSESSIFSKRNKQNNVITKSAESCVCVPHYRCFNGTIDSSGKRVLDLRGAKENPCGDENIYDVCCKDGNVVISKIKPTTTEPYSGCGYRNGLGVGFRIIGDDDESQYGEFPWMVALLLRNGFDKRSNTIRNGSLNYKCGGSLIHPEVVLTAAHCVTGISPKALLVRAGEWDFTLDQEMYSHQDVEIGSILVHPHFNKGSMFNDIALLFLQTAITLEEHIGLACLSSKNVHINGHNCFVTGWGKDVFGKRGAYQAILKKIEMPIVPRPKCLQALRKTKLSHRFRLHGSFICAGGEEGRDACQGDGGSPLVCPIREELDRYVQSGIVSWGIGCGANIPGVYTNVAHLRNWIDQELISRNIDISVYEPEYFPDY